MTWANLGALAWLGLVLALAAIFVVGARRHRRTLVRWFPKMNLDRIVPPSVRRRRIARDVLFLIGMSGVIVAWADPRWGEKVYTVEQSGVDLVVAVDLSRSMDAADVDPSRLERARREMVDLIGLLKGDRVGLVIFAGGAYPRMPLTQDYDALRLLVEELDTGVFQSQGSALGEAIRISVDLLGRQKGQAGQGILVLSDGEIHDPADALAAADAAAANGIRIYSMGIGQKAAPIPLPGGNFVTERGGEVVLSTPSSEVLTDVARRTGGAYVSSVAAVDDMSRLYVEMRGELEHAKGTAVQRKTSESAFTWPLGAGILALLLGSWLGEGRRAAAGAVKVAAGLVVCFALTTGDPAHAATRADGDRLYRDGRYAESVQVFKELTLEQPSNPDLWGRLAAAKYRAGDVDGAARAWDMQDRVTGGDASASYNAGNAYYQSGRLEEAIRRYDRALQLRPDHPAAQQNRQVVSQEMEARRKQQPPPPASKDASQGQQGDARNAQGSEGNSGPPQPGDPQQKPSEKQEGQPSESGAAQDDPALQGQQRQAGEGREGQGKNGQQTQGERDPHASSGPGAPNGEAQPGQGGEPQSEGTMSSQQADRLLDGVEEGRPRIIIPDDGKSGKPW